jgi:YVTN family beta-propeller protein
VLELFDAWTLAPVGKIPVASHPEQIVVLPDGATAFVSSADTNKISAVDLHRRVLLANLELAGPPGRMILKPDGGELYVTVPDSHEMEIVNTRTTEVAQSMPVGLAPLDGTLTSNAEELYISDAAAGRVFAIAIGTRHLDLPVAVGRRPGICRLDPSGELLLVTNQDSNDLAVMRVRDVQGGPQAAPGLSIGPLSLLTMVPVGAHPSDVAILLF